MKIKNLNYPTPEEPSSRSALPCVLLNLRSRWLLAFKSVPMEQWQPKPCPCWNPVALHHIYTGWFMEILLYPVIMAYYDPTYIIGFCCHRFFDREASLARWTNSLSWHALRLSSRELFQRWFLAKNSQKQSRVKVVKHVCSLLVYLFSSSVIVVILVFLGQIWQGFGVGGFARVFTVPCMGTTWSDKISWDTSRKTMILINLWWHKHWWTSIIVG